MGLRNVKVGDRVWTIQAGWTKVVTVCFETSGYPIRMASGHNYTIDGKYHLQDMGRAAFLNPPIEIIAPPANLKNGDPVYVAAKGRPDIWFRRYFSHEAEEGGRYYCYADGKTEWTSDGKTQDWSYIMATHEKDSQEWAAWAAWAAANSILWNWQKNP